MSVEAVVPGAAPGALRWRAAAWDYLGIVGWLALATVVAAGVRTALGASTAPVSPAATDLIAFTTTVLPVGLYLGISEARSGAAFGKRRAGLLVIGPAGGPPGASRAALRTAVKLLPWQLAHVAVVRLAFGVDEPVVVAISNGAALLLPVLSVLVACRDPERRALHDLVAGTRVVRCRFAAHPVQR